MTQTNAPTAFQYESMPPVVRADVLSRLREDGHAMTIVDVRTPAEVEAVHIPGSYNVPLDQISEHRDEFHGVGEPIVLVCRSGAGRARPKRSFVPRTYPACTSSMVGSWPGSGQAAPSYADELVWSIERQVRAIAGALVVLGTLGSLLVWQPLIYLALFVGAGLLFAGLTDTCAMGMLLMRLPHNRAATCDVAGVLSRLKDRPVSGQAAKLA